jgi:hypothetical protein
LQTLGACRPGNDREAGIRLPENLDECPSLHRVIASEVDPIRVDGVMIEEVGASEHDHARVVLAGQTERGRYRMGDRGKVRGLRRE